MAPGRAFAGTQTRRARHPERVAQFSIFTPNRLGKLNELIKLFSTHGVNVLGLMVVDTTDSAVIRLVVDGPDQARELLSAHEFPFTESKLVVVEANATDLPQLMSVMLEAELNVNYLYSFIPQPRGKSLLAFSIEDNDVAEQALQRHQFTTLTQADLSR